ncbi:lmo0937 family membrane protein [Salipaludibacillus sp. LMS25]|nr:lmo0937 family membrane protein [Salipaludibacillus sp. LMS25]UTR13918.1 lmo0937 family membrane protein [Salipaludibacillus sp. LMS25]
MLWTIISILILFWLVGLVLDLVGGLIHIILVIALIVLIVRMIRGRG